MEAKGSLPTISLRRVLCLVSMAILVPFGPLFSAQKISIKVVDGRNGRPVAGVCMNVMVGDSPTRPITMMATDQDGVAFVHLEGDTASTRLKTRTQPCKRGGSGVSDLVASYGDTISLGPANFADCRPFHTNSTILYHYPISRILHDGLELKNSCGKVRVAAKPGELILFVRPKHWWNRGAD